MDSQRQEIRRIIRRALEDARPEVARRVARADPLADGLALSFTPRLVASGQESSLGKFDKKLVVSQDARMTFDPELVLACYDALRSVAIQEGRLADVQEFSVPDQPHLRLAFAEKSDHVIAYLAH